MLRSKNGWNLTRTTRSSYIYLISLISPIGFRSDVIMSFRHLYCACLLRPRIPSFVTVSPTWFFLRIRGLPLRLSPSTLASNNFLDWASSSTLNTWSSQRSRWMLMSMSWCNSYSPSLVRIRLSSPTFQRPKISQKTFLPNTFSARSFLFDIIDASASSRSMGTMSDLWSVLSIKRGL